MNCNRCGHENTIQQRFCHKCGTALDRGKANVKAELEANDDQSRINAWETRAVSLLAAGWALFLAGLFIAIAYRELPVTEVTAGLPLPLPRIPETPLPGTATLALDDLPLPKLRPVFGIFGHERKTGRDVLRAIAAPDPRLDLAATQAIQWLVAAQGPDGGWGKDMDPAGRNYVTALALEALATAGLVDEPKAREAWDKGIAFLISHWQNPGPALEAIALPVLVRARELQGDASRAGEAAFRVTVDLANALTDGATWPAGGSEALSDAAQRGLASRALGLATLAGLLPERLALKPLGGTGADEPPFVVINAFNQLAFEPLKGTLIQAKTAPLPEPAKGSWPAESRFWAEAGLVAFQSGEPAWSAWQKRLVEEILPIPSKDGPLAASFPGVNNAPGSRELTTALAVRTLLSWAVAPPFIPGVEFGREQNPAPAR